ncbi:MAG: DNA adenine methylase [Alphaproteobacteria bacterium]|nr:DNA adenine methylase [Alphaproteobacteria bacterium]
MQKVTKPLMKYHGGKWRIAPWVIKHFPDHQAYVEPFGGAAGVLLQKNPAPIEIYNDLDNSMVNLFRVIQCPDQSAKLQHVMANTLYARAEFESAYEPTDCQITQAKNTLVKAWMGFGSAGATRKGRIGFMNHSSLSVLESEELYKSNRPESIFDLPNRIATVRNRLKNVVIECKRALDIIPIYDAPETLFYIDPPYVLETRGGGAKGSYRHELDDAQQLELLEMVKQIKGGVVLSGYPNDLYDDHLSGWHKKITTVSIASGRSGGAQRTECLWINPLAVENTNIQQSLWADA